ncbi:hypothetical protein JOD24_001438 [Kroppenstedtia sanguinis]|uniref:Uncharacterized protein n=1 Tax=Kroppenstedtia sanguinis TaxID=1380684 RepID=A0ABW4CCZ1_9BACL
MNSCELVVAFNLRSDAPEIVIRTLDYMTNIAKSIDAEEPDFDPPDHPLFQTENWEFMLWRNDGSFAGFPYSELQIVEVNGEKYIDVVIRTYISLGFEQIAHFIEWIKPFIEGAGEGKHFIGYWRFEDDEFYDTPHIIHV